MSKKSMIFFATLLFAFQANAACPEAKDIQPALAKWYSAVPKLGQEDFTNLPAGTSIIRSPVHAIASANFIKVIETDKGLSTKCLYVDSTSPDIVYLELSIVNKK